MGGGGLPFKRWGSVLTHPHRRSYVIVCVGRKEPGNAIKICAIF